MEGLIRNGRPGSLCWYGDHVPIMPQVYARWGEPPGVTPWLIWATDERVPSPKALPAHALAEHWLTLLAEWK